MENQEVLRDSTNFEASEELEELLNQEGIQHPLIITSAVSLKEHQIERIVSLFQDKTGEVVDQVDLKVDPTLLTGVKIQSKSFYYERSGKRLLKELHEYLNKQLMEGE